MGILLFQGGIMSEENKGPAAFLGTYFDRDTVLRVARWAEILSWVVAVIYVADMILAVGVFVLQTVRGFWVWAGPTDMATNILLIIERPFRGIVYFVALQAIGKALLILMDMENNLRQAARK
jgi:hypothetical protein